LQSVGFFRKNIRSFFFAVANTFLHAQSQVI
jgi:hypothetical protein